ncbi:DUF4132 domain-containing protein [Corynebacterium cystitidis]|uniref:DUF4132 domain-containing protein n=1 Tax=Corynebacterium cystitidis DSM 20524 TaxID=1121357 RepID=A0A1H9PT83_9CORY|nr:DUF4132 domain-containing protein [Corynebacterium cystitidis]WJY82391.1 hypothetical protein CCYS_07335 [Corynebacterium cystitidis DSM 20524]SER51402.1 protein of unknown function [Corynebacterium cystitidis DSM 20524]SNV76018.1 Uncharacterised protein [Corynebacterium cystitidis]
MTWIEGNNYDFALDADTAGVVVRNKKGTVLKTVPAKAKVESAYETIDTKANFLEQHARTCRDTVRAWLLGDVTVPTRVIAAVWDDKAWQKQLGNLVITDGAATGLLRHVSPEALTVIDLDGEEATMIVDETTVVSIPHPVLLPDLEDWREFAIDLGVQQEMDQLMRDVYQKPADRADGQVVQSSFKGSEYSRAGALIGRARGAGYSATFNSIGMTMEENGTTVGAYLEVEAWAFDDTAHIYNLHFTSGDREAHWDEISHTLWSEAVRMANYVYAGRTNAEAESQ